MSAQTDGANTRPKPFANTAFDLVALVASARGLNASSQVPSSLSINFPAATVVVQHLAPDHQFLMVEILSRRMVLPIPQAQ